MNASFSMPCTCEAKVMEVRAGRAELSWARDRDWEVRVGNRTGEEVSYSFQLCDRDGACTGEKSARVRPAQRDRHFYRVRRSDAKDLRLIIQWHDGREWQQRAVWGDVNFVEGRGGRIEFESQRR